MLIINHCIEQKEYLEWKKKILEELTAVKEWEAKRKDGFTQVHCYTQAHPFYTSLRKRFYYGGRKTVDEHIVKTLDPRGLAIWFMDDGCWHNSGGHRSLLLSTACFNLSEHILMVRELFRRFGLEFRINRHSFRKDEVRYKLRLRNADLDKFWGLVSPVVSQINCMKYKLDSHADTPNGGRHSLNFVATQRDEQKCLIN